MYCLDCKIDLKNTMLIENSLSCCHCRNKWYSDDGISVLSSNALPMKSEYPTVSSKHTQNPRFSNGFPPSAQP